MQSFDNNFDIIIDEYLDSLPNHNLYSPIKYMMGISGKRLRPNLTLEFAKQINFNQIDAQYIALSIELFHNFTLIHDDIMDNSPLRRGVKTVHNQFDTNSAILSGDNLFTESFRILNKVNCLNKNKLFDRFCITSNLVCEGQQDDMDFEKRKVIELDEYITMIRKKTAVLLSFCVESIAIASEMDENTIKNLINFAENIGIAFQIQDDIYDIFPQDTKMGKIIGGDILNKKKTFPYLYLLMQFDDYEKQKIINTFEQKDNSNRLNDIHNIMIKYDIENKSTLEFENYYHKAINCIMNINAFDTTFLINFANHILQRRY